MTIFRYALPIVLLAALVVLLWSGLGGNPGYVPSPLIDKPAPEFSLSRIDDPATTLSRENLLGDVSLVNVWATWCAGCREEHPYLVQLARTSGVRIFGIDWKDDPQQARQWLAQFGNPYIATGMDQEGRVAIDWGVYGAPETFLLDARGTVLYKHIAPLTPAVWEAEFVPRIRKARGLRP